MQPEKLQEPSQLTRIIKSKEASGREKDRLALPVLRDALATIEALEKN
ncbi:MAG: hypothetical protein MUP98_07105 [Candidatus Aminicenantes bacterium]|nr:hypothetical protein [Candidatus Aminicenantes bacterium]